MKFFLKYWLPVVFWAGLIFYLSNISGLSSGLQVFWDVFLRKLAHATEFGILFFLLFRALLGHKLSFNKTLIFSLFLAVLYAFSDEAHQYFVPGREARLKDVGVDSLGILFFFGITYLYGRLLYRK